jgi:asparagine synthase (glutamine-hydrolysing)
MCGIAGYLNIKNGCDKNSLAAATDLIAHRGPDAAGYFFNEANTLGLAHRRLSIIDLSTAANQPMYSHCNRYVMVYNGEVYNYKELKLQLPQQGAALKTNGDSEIVLELFAQKGPAIFAELNGMFAIAIFDKDTQQLFLARDHVGIKPLFVGINNEGALAFGSELKVVKQLLNNKLSINHTAVASFLHVGFIPQPLTIYNNVFKFPSGSYTKINCALAQQANFLETVKPFWNDAIATNTINDEAIAKKELNNLLVDSIEKQLVSDVPIGTFLSGGIDSSIVTAIASKVFGKKVNTFSLAIANGKYNEATFAKAVSEALNTNHHEFSVTEKEVLEMVPRFMQAYDEPYADSSAFPTMLVSRLARQHVTVTLSGDGGDELFMGYGSYTWGNRLQHPIIKAGRKPLYAAAQLMPAKYKRAAHVLDYNDKQNTISHIFSQEHSFFKEKEIEELLVKPERISTQLHNNLYDSDLSFNEQQSYWDVAHYLKDDLLVKTDRASMQFSLETRVPILDYRIVDFARKVNPSLKIKNGVQKYLLKEVLYDYLPKAIFDRPKWGFAIPLQQWLKTDLNYLLEKYTSEAIINQYGLVQYKNVAQLKTRFLKGEDYLFARLWLIIVLHWWCSENNG